MRLSVGHKRDLSHYSAMCKEKCYIRLLHHLLLNHVLKLLLTWTYSHLFQNLKMQKLQKIHHTLPDLRHVFHFIFFLYLTMPSCFTYSSCIFCLLVLVKLYFIHVSCFHSSINRTEDSVLSVIAEIPFVLLYGIRASQTNVSLPFWSFSSLCLLLLLLPLPPIPNPLHPLMLPLLYQTSATSPSTNSLVTTIQYGAP